MTELKPCPFCGGEAVLQAFYGGNYVECGTCKCSTERFIKTEDAIQAWNNRPNPWHTGTPTDRDGIFLIRTKMNNLFLVKWADGFWEETTGDDCLEDNDILAWQKITPYDPREERTT